MAGTGKGGKTKEVVEDRQVKQSCVCDKVVCERWGVCVCVSVVCERERVTKLCVKNGVCVCVKVV